MQLTSIVLSTGLALALAPAGALAWAQAANGVWVASNTWYSRVGNYNNVHESCTRMNSQIVLTNGEDCSYWTNGQGAQGHGRSNARGAAPTPSPRANTPRQTAAAARDIRHASRRWAVMAVRGEPTALELPPVARPRADNSLDHGCGKGVKFVQEMDGLLGRAERFLLIDKGRG
ncbi:hypothetical protein B0T21DRAFT_411979 [Apiosordaria backusii]|uniref:Uncharacterized protein n=1 Tax=Apiosordaria backusii TaxID=314023 RepID=A0AA40BJH2_9PEZI|nr:hypothetical protein B0T21DRAFT_411979 [Apiosordaria backusii]